MLHTPTLLPTKTPEMETCAQPGTGHFVSSPALLLSHSHPHAIAYKSPFSNTSPHLSISPPSISISQELQALTFRIFLPE